MPNKLLKYPLLFLKGLGSKDAMFRVDGRGGWHFYLVPNPTCCSRGLRSLQFEEHATQNAFACAPPGSGAS